MKDPVTDEQWAQMQQNEQLVAKIQLLIDQLPRADKRRGGIQKSLLAALSQAPDRPTLNAVYGVAQNALLDQTKHESEARSIIKHLGLPRSR